MFQQSSASSAQGFFLMRRQKGESPRETRRKQCKAPFANSAGSVCLFDLQKSRMIAEAPRTRCHSAFAAGHLNCDYLLIYLFAVIHLLSQEQAFGSMTYSLKRVLGDSPRHWDNKALCRKFRAEN